jgi:signal transduction histidine kinase
MLAALALAWIALALWQRQEYQAECNAARDALRRQAESVTNALVGGVQSHRRLGRFLEDQLQGALDELAKSQDILAVGVVSNDRRIALMAGRSDLLDLSKSIEPGASWDAAGFRYATEFQLSAEPPGGGMGLGRGGGWGRGVGSAAQAAVRELLAAGGRFWAVLVLDRTQTDERIARYAWLRTLVTVAGGLLIISVGLAWRATVRLAETRGQARLLEIEARHLRELSQAAAGLAHETRNPLGLIRGWTQRWAQTLDDNPRQQQQAEAIIEECDRVTARINQFLAFTRPCEPKKAAVRPAEVIDELAALLTPDLDAKHLKLQIEPPGTPSTIQADREMLRQALFNLLQNAMEFSPEGGTVEIGVCTGHDRVLRIEVSDRGPGVPAEAVERLFTPYHTTRSNGTGLGLAIVRRIAVAHGWAAGYTPRPGGGSVFWLDGIHD